MLNNYQLEVLKKGAYVEATEGVKVHSYPERETGDLLGKYYAYVLMEINYDKVDKEIVDAALLDLYDFWACYFACGAETAYKLLEEQRLEAIAAVEAKQKAYYNTWGGMI